MWRMVGIVAFITASAVAGLRGQSSATPAEPPPIPADGPYAGYAASARTGVPIVDRVLGALQQEDVTTLLELVLYDQVPCGPPDHTRPLPPACRPGEEPGTRVRVLRVSANACTYDYFRPGHVAEALGDFIKYRGRLFGVGRVPPDRPWSIDVLFMRRDGTDVYSPRLQIDGQGRIRAVVLKGACSTPRDTASEWVGPYILGPRVRR